jgi:hypothetical protein
MGRRTRWGYQYLFGPWAGEFKKVEKKQASKKRRQRDKTDI